MEEEEDKVMQRKKVLFICTHNSARSQLAEALLRKYYDDLYEAFSAGTVATIVKPEVITVLEELGIDTSPLRSKTLDSFKKMKFDVVVTVCDNARETCPFYPYSTTYIHQAFFDPSNVTDSKERRVDAFRKSRDDIKAWIDKVLGSGEVAREPEIRLQLFEPDIIK